MWFLFCWNLNLVTSQDEIFWLAGGSKQTRRGSRGDVNKRDKYIFGVKDIGTKLHPKGPDFTDNQGESCWCAI